ncbi:MAG: TRAP transporter large permease [Alphaproteobacteria bacterium]|nr:TRAP transporter large permease [Alphaproteobacteria bacterium]
MSNFELGLLFFALTIVLILSRMPVGIAMFVMGALGYSIMVGWQPLMFTLNNSTYSRLADYNLSVIPLFIFMGQLATKAGINRALFKAASAWFGHWRGGLAMATIGGCAAFGAICGSSLATAATMSQVAMPEMRRYNYSGALTTGTLAAGGTLGILIPPSIILVIYAIYTETSIGFLFLAAFIPGIIATVQYMIVVAIYVRIAPNSGPAIAPLRLRQRLMAMKEIWLVVVVFLLVIGGIYNGWFSPTEGAAIGCFAVGVLAITVGGMRWREFRSCLVDTAETTALIYLILIGTEIFNAFIALTQMAAEITGWIGSLGLPPLAILFLMLLIYLILGCVMDSLAMVLLTLPVFIPILFSLDFGLTKEQVAIWFGILALVSVEVGMITPPFGLNIFVINAMSKTVPLQETYVGVLGFVGADVLRIILLAVFPAISLVGAGLW